MYPVQIRIHERSSLIIEWDDNSSSVIPLLSLRSNCPCASCMAEKENKSQSYIPLFFSDQTKILKITSVGKYAINVLWADGHNTGIYEYTFLKKLSVNTSI